MRRISLFISSVLVALLLQIHLSAAEQSKSWVQLSPSQQEALAPLAAQWDSLPTKLQNNLLHATNYYPRLDQMKKQRFQSQLEKWSKLTPEQRERARAKYKATHPRKWKQEQVNRPTRPPIANTSNVSSVSHTGY